MGHIHEAGYWVEDDEDLHYCEFCDSYVEEPCWTEYEALTCWNYEDAE